MEFLIVLLTIALATGISGHIFLVSPILKYLKIHKPDSFGAKNSKKVSLVSFTLLTLLFPFIMLVLLRDSYSKIFILSLEASLAEE